MKRFFLTLSLGFGLSALFTAPQLGAVDVISQTVNVPFNFKAAGATLPSGDYRIERDFGRQTVYVVNIRTGQQIQVFRNNPSLATRITLTFETNSQGERVLRIS